MADALTFAAMLAVTLGQPTVPDSVDLLRIKEAFRLTAAVQNSVWPGGWGPVPFPLLLVTPEREFLIADRRTPPGFTQAGDSIAREPPILERPRQFQPDLLATFPAFGPPSVIVIGRPESTGKTSTTWILTVVHEHFHQYQYDDPEYFSAVERLGLSGGDQTGMWMLNYPFPYQSAPVGERFAALSHELGRLVEHSSASERRAFWDRYAAFLGDLSEADRRYLSFQLWQEGVARYVELRATEAAARRYEPSAEFRALPDFQSLADVAAGLRAAILDELANPNLAARRRVSFYAFGAGLALLLDQDVPDWKNRYRREKFFLERYLVPAR
ncbi:MAG: hypothetical protein ACT4PM_03850 [Gemmatimonadales bacterium]